MPESVTEVRRAEVMGVNIDGQKAECIIRDGASILVSRLLGRYVLRGDTIEVSLPNEATSAETEIFIHKDPDSKSKDVYQAPIGYVTKPKEDRRGQFYSLAEVRSGALGITNVRLNCEVIRDYFYVARRTSRRSQEQPSFYEVLKTGVAASLAELRLAYRLRDLELRTGRGEHREVATIERAFNILAEPDLRACYDALLRDPETPVLIPYGGFGSLVVEGEPSRDGKTFFARRILAFSPDRHDRCFKAPLRKFQFCADRAVYRDARRRLELVVDQAAMPIVWDPTWNQWKHLLGTKVDVQATFLQTGVYRMQGGEWNLLSWQKALPSRIRVTLPADINEQIETARRRHHIFGQHADFLARLRARIEREPVAKSEIERLFGEVGIPGDFGAEQVTWKAGYDPLYYHELLNHARQVYLFRDEFIMELDHAIAVEKPESGYATYLFAKPESVEQFLRFYAAVTRDDILRNRHNVAERLRFLCRVPHGAKHEAWLNELKVFLRE